MTATTTTYFTKLQADTLDGLYEDVENWWFFFYVLSDEVEEISPVAADGMRWLHRIKQRPWAWEWDRRKWKRAKKSHPLRMHWWILQETRHGECDNYLPVEFREISTSHRFAEYPGPTPALSAFLEEWCALSEETRQRLWREWVK